MNRIDSRASDRREGVTDACYWEGNIVDAIATYLVREGWEIISKADTLSRARGVDIHAKRADRTLRTEVKGFPSGQYRDPKRAGELKRTNPNSQALQWYSHALLTAVRLRVKYPNDNVALGFPDFPRYIALFAETQQALGKLGITFMTVDENQKIGRAHV